MERETLVARNVLATGAVAGGAGWVRIIAKVDCKIDAGKWEAESMFEIGMETAYRQRVWSICIVRN